MPFLHSLFYTAKYDRKSAKRDKMCQKYQNFDIVGKDKRQRGEKCENNQRKTDG